MGDANIILILSYKKYLQMALQVFFYMDFNPKIGADAFLLEESKSGRKNKLI